MSNRKSIRRVKLAEQAEESAALLVIRHRKSFVRILATPP